MDKMCGKMSIIDFTYYTDQNVVEVKSEVGMP
jgi:hypothetical protein